jgi:thiamine pyrophosphate-dependent acetolactate synthase large subunit-like protein
LAADTAKEWARRLWVFDKPYRHPGRSLGTGAKIGISLGVALAHKGSGKLVVDLQPDGDLMYDASSLWVAAHHRIPMLVVMYNNRSYYGVWEYQATVAKQARFLKGVPCARRWNAQLESLRRKARRPSWTPSPATGSVNQFMEP